jgi:hypothetical protein
VTSRAGRARGPDVRLPLTYLAMAAIAFVGATVQVSWLATELTGHYYHPGVLALTHTVTLGWITLAILGASYQLIPIVLKCPLWSERLPWWQLPALMVGIAGMLAHFYIGEWSGMLWAAILVAIAVGAHVVNLTLTLRATDAPSLLARFVIVALAGISLTMLAGLALAFHHLHPFLPGDFYARLGAHVHLAVLGWVLPMILGVAAQTYPMFLLGSGHDTRLERIQLGGVVAGVPALVAGLVLSRVVAVGGAVIVTATVAAHLTSLARMVWRHKAPRLDWPVRFLLTAAALLVPATLAGLALVLDVADGPRWALAYGVLALGGWVSLTIVGMMLKIVPFLTWYGAYSHLAGREAVPSLVQLEWPAAEATAFVGLAGGIIMLTVGVATGRAPVIRVAGVLLLIGAFAFAAALARMLSHLLPAGRSLAVTGSARR